MEKMYNAAYFDLWYTKVVGWEGGLSKHKNDRAADAVPEFEYHTNKGITLQTWFYYAESIGVKGNKQEKYKKFLKMSDKQHRAIALAYWYASGADNINDGRIAAFFAEMFWGGGHPALSFYQRRLSIRPADGIIGRNSAKIINNQDQTALFVQLSAWRKTHYALLIKNRPQNEVFADGWERRRKEFYYLFLNFKPDENDNDNKKGGAD